MQTDILLYKISLFFKDNIGMLVVVFAIAFAVSFFIALTAGSENKSPKNKHYRFAFGRDSRMKNEAEQILIQQELNKSIKEMRNRSAETFGSQSIDDNLVEEEKKRDT